MGNTKEERSVLRSSLRVGLEMLLVLGVLYVLLPSVGFAAEGDTGGAYLAGYENQTPVATSATGVSWWSTFAYIGSLLVVFLFVAGLAYAVSRFLGGRMGRAVTAHGGRILEHLPLGPNRSVCIVEMGNHIFLLGVTEHSITLLREIEDPEEVEELLESHKDISLTSSVSGVFGEQFGAIDAMVKRVPSLFKKNDVWKS